MRGAGCSAMQSLRWATSCLSMWRSAPGKGAAASSSCLITHQIHLSTSSAHSFLPSHLSHDLGHQAWVRMEGLCVGFEEFSDPEGEAGGVWVSGSLLWAWWFQRNGHLFSYSTPTLCQTDVEMRDEKMAAHSDLAISH